MEPGLVLSASNEKSGAALTTYTAAVFMPCKQHYKKVDAIVANRKWRCAFVFRL